MALLNVFLIINPPWIYNLLKNIADAMTYSKTGETPLLVLPSLPVCGMLIAMQSLISGSSG